MVRLALLFLLLAPAAGAQTVLDPLIARGTYDTPSLAFGAAAGPGDIVWVADHASGVLALDLSDPDLPAPVLSANTPSFARNVALTDSLLLVADRFSGLRVYRTDGATTLQFRGTVDTPGLALGVASYGSYAIVADKETGLQVIDVADPTSPQIVGSVDTPGFASDVAVDGAYAYVADFDQGVRIVDLGDPTQPTSRDVYPTIGDANGITVRDGLAFVAAGASGLLVLDVSDPDLITLHGSLNTPGTANEVALAGDVLLMAAGTSGLQVIDIADPAAPVLLDSYLTTSAAYHVARIGRFAALACGASGVEVVEVFAEEATSAPMTRAGRPTLLPARPNPFNPSTTLSWVPAATGEPVELTVYDLAGRRVRRFEPGVQEPVRQSVTWDGRDAAGRSVSSGVYLVHLSQGSEIATGKVTLVE